MQKLKIRMRKKETEAQLYTYIYLSSNEIYKAIKKFLKLRAAGSTVLYAYGIVHLAAVEEQAK